MSAAPRRRAKSASAVIAPITIPCQTNCRSAHATARAAGCRKRAADVSLAIVTSVVSMCATPGLLFALHAIEDVSDLAELVGRRALGGERLHDELPRRAAECAIEQVADELALRLVFAERRPIDVRPFALVAFDQALLGHDLQQLQRGGVGAVPAARELLVNLTNRARPAFPENPQDGELGVRRFSGIP